MAIIIRGLRLLLSALVVAAIATACSSDSAPVDDPSDRGILDPEEAGPDGLETLDFQNNLEGTVTSAQALSIGDCFNEYVWLDRTGTQQEAMTRLSCSRPHDGEVFHVDLHPAGRAPFPGDRKLADFAQDICLELFEPFVKTEYILSDLEIGMFTPSFDSWNNDGDRRVTCYVYAFAGGLLRGSMANIGL